MRRATLRLIVTGAAMTATASMLPAGMAFGHATLSGTSSAHGFYVTGYGRVTTSADAAQIQDRQGREHVLVAGKSHFKYLTKWRGQKWQHHRMGGDPSRHAGNQAVRGTLLSTDGKRVTFLVKGRSFTSASVKARRLPRPQEIATDSQCGLLYAGPAALPDNKLAFVAKNVNDQTWQVCHGTPGGDMSAAPLAGMDGLLPASGVVRDASDGTLYVLAQGDVQDAVGYFVWSSTDDAKTWSGPEQIPPLTLGEQNSSGELPALWQDVQSVVAGDGQIWIAALSESAGQQFTAPVIVHRTTGGTWQEPEAIPHTTAMDDNLSLAFNDRSGVLHLIYTHALEPGAFEGKITHQFLSMGEWSASTRLTNGFDDPQNLVIGYHGHAVVGYIRKVSA
jgi:hypothetical protein